MWRYWSSEVIDFNIIWGYKGILYQIHIVEDRTSFERTFRIYIRRPDTKSDSWMLRLNVGGFEEWEFGNLSPLSQKNYLVSMIMERIGIESMQSTDFYK